MELCSLCQSIPFDALPPLPKWNGLSRHGDDTNMPVLWLAKDRKISEEPFGFAYHKNLDALALSAGTCNLCAVVQAGVQSWIDRYRVVENTNKRFIRQQERRGKSEFPAEEQLWLNKRNSGSAGFVVCTKSPNVERFVYLLAGVGFSVDAESEWVDEFKLRPLQTNSGSPQTMQVASVWIHECVVKHDRCHDEEAELPSRVLDLGSSDDPDIIKLIYCNGMRGKYVSLSHCWGTSGHFTTTTESIEAHLTGFHISLLPKTFRDAVDITRRIGLKYIWIDSLCICQDDQADWARESARMIHIYKDAHLVLAANHAADNSAGCFSDRSDRARKTLNIPNGRAQGATVEALALWPGGEANSMWTEDWEGQPLMTRAWALQERVLGRRILHFNSDQCYFECAQGIRGEDGHFSERCYYDLDAQPHESERPPLHSHDHAKWNRLLWAYGERSLSRFSDRFPAMSGLASLFEQRIGAKYVAGLWSDALIEGLAWQCLTSTYLGDASIAAAGYVAPTWSWASYPGIAAANLEKGWVDSASILGWDVQLKTSNPYGEITSAWIDIHAPIIELTPSEVDEDNEKDWYNTDQFARLCTSYGDDKGELTRFEQLHPQKMTGEEIKALNLKGLVLGGYLGPRDVKDNEGKTIYTKSESVYVMVVREAKGQEGKGDGGSEGRTVMAREGWFLLGKDESRKMLADIEEKGLKRELRLI